MANLLAKLFGFGRSNANDSQSPSISAQYRALVTLENARRHLEQYGWGNECQYTNARNILLYAQREVAREMRERLS
jgi:hypothetical protein